MQRSTFLAFAAALLLLSACGGTSGGTDDGGTGPFDSGIPPVGATHQSLSHDFPGFDLAPGENDWGICQSWRLNNDTPIWLHSVRMSSNGSFHHSNWTFSPDDMNNPVDGSPKTDGTWNCSSRNWDELSAGIAGGVLFAQSTQAANDLQVFPDGDAVLIPAHSEIIGGVHVLNTGTSSVSTHIKFDETYGDGEVRTALQPMYIDYLPLSLPPHMAASAETTCDLKSRYAFLSGRSQLDFHFVYVLPHFHQMATDWRLEVVGGPHDGEAIYQHDGALGDPLGMTLTTPFDMTGATGVRMRCTYDNPTSHEVNYGLTLEAEMCTMLAYTDGPVKFANVVYDGTNVVGPVVDGVQTNTGRCNVNGF